MLKRIWNKLGFYRVYPYKLNGRTYRVPVHKGLGMSNFNDPENWMLVVLSKIGAEDKTLVDVGVNVGQTLLKWRALFPHAPYLGCEPNKACVLYVENLIRENGFMGCELVNAGISSKSGEATLYLLGDDRGDSSASIIQNFRANEHRKGIQISLTTFHELDLKRCDILKVDVEGSELGVIQSLFETTFRPVIVIEVLPVYSTENTDRFNRQQLLESLIKKHNYHLFRIQKGEQIKLDFLTEIGIHQNMNWCDYLLVPAEMKDGIISKFQE